MFLRLSNGKYINSDFVKYFEVQINDETNWATIPPSKVVQYVIVYNLTEFDNEQKWLPERYTSQEEAQDALDELLEYLNY